MKILKRHDYKVVDKCKECKCQLPKYSKHHYLCEKCWKEEQLKKGNFTVLNKGKFRVSI
jgi:hypothetical protein